MPIGLQANNIISPLARVLDNNGNPIAGLNTTIEVVDLVTSTATNGPICDKSYREGFAGTLEYMRFSSVCKVDLLNATSLTNSLGQADFGNFVISM